VCFCWDAGIISIRSILKCDSLYSPTLKSVTTYNNVFACFHVCITSNHYNVYVVVRLLIGSKADIEVCAYTISGHTFERRAVIPRSSTTFWFLVILSSCCYRGSYESVRTQTKQYFVVLLVVGQYYIFTSFFSTPDKHTLICKLTTIRIVIAWGKHRKIKNI